MEYRFRPLVNFVPSTKFRVSSRFGSTWTQTLKLLDRELRHLGAKNIVIQVALDESQLRLDGMIRADARPRHPAVVIGFDSKHGAMSYPCDKFLDWQDNVRAIALSLESLRQVDRYGVTRSAEQYRGWQALPPPASQSGQHGNTPWWRQENADQMAIGFLRSIVGDDCAACRDIDALIRQAEKKTHPDLGGDAENFKNVQRARNILKNGKNYHG